MFFFEIHIYSSNTADGQVFVIKFASLLHDKLPFIHFSVPFFLILAIGQFKWNIAAVQNRVKSKIIKRKQAYIARNPKSTVRKTKFQYNLHALTNQSPLWDPKMVLFIHSVEAWDLCGRVLDWGGPENNLSGKLYQIVLA